jgi:hypothetical protein
MSFHQLAILIIANILTLSMHCLASSPSLNQAKYHPGTTTIHQLAILPHATILYPCIILLLALHLVKWGHDHSLTCHFT